MLRAGTLVSKVVAVSLLAIALMAVSQFVILPLIGIYQDGNQRIATAEEQRQRYQALAAQQPVLAERMASLEEGGAQATDSYLKGPSDALAAAQLQNLVSATITAAQGEIKTTQIMAAEDVEDGPPLRRAGLVLQFTTNLQGLSQALYDLETAEPQLFIAKLVVGEEKPSHLRNRIANALRRNARKEAQNDAQNNGDEQENEEQDNTQQLTVRMSVFGYVRPEA